MTNNKLNIFSRKAQQLITNQLIQYNQEQLYKGNNQQTIDRKTEQFIDFMSYSYQIEELTKENVSQKLFSYVYNGSYGNVLRDIRKLNNKIGLIKNEETFKNDLFTMVEDVYIDSQNKKQPTYRLYKNILLMYVLRLNGDKYIEFQAKYIQAFDYIEQQYRNYMAERMKIKDGFYKIYNDLRAENAKLLLNKGI